MHKISQQPIHAPFIYSLKTVFVDHNEIFQNYKYDEQYIQNNTCIQNKLILTFVLFNITLTPFFSFLNIGHNAHTCIFTCEFLLY